MAGFAVDFDDVARAAQRLRGVAHRTPAVTSATLDERTGARVVVKAENLQRMGAFKFRGAYNRLVQLDDAQRRAGVVAFSSGNHAQGVALAARLLGLHATIVMPADAPASKLAATRGYGADVVIYDRRTEDRNAIARGIAAERGATIVPPFDDPAIIAGAGTAALELIEDTGYLRTVSYSASAQNGTDYGQPTTVQGALITQSDGSNRQPTTTTTYDAVGRPATVANGNATYAYSYDGMGRVLTISDPDLTSVKALTETYYPDGSPETTQTPSQAAAGVSSAFAYDLDGNLVSRTTHFANTLETWHYWYDGADHLIEQSSPQDPNTPGDFVGLTKFYRDFSSGLGVASQSGQALTAYGNLFDSLKWVPQYGWLETNFTGFDALDRVIASYGYKPCANTGAAGPINCQTTYKTSYAFDATSASVGFLGSATDGLNQTRSYTYDARGLLAGIQYSGDGGVTPAVQYVYDADGSPTSLTSATLGTETLSYNADEVLQSVQESAAMGGGSISYAHYGDGSLQSESVGGALLSQANLLNYSYRNDGLLATKNVNYSGGATLTYIYTAGGRLTAMADFSGTSRTQSYDTYGRVSQYTIPAGSYSGLAYDAEGDLTGYSAYSGEAVSLTYNVRGELTGESFSPNGMTNGYSNFPAFAAPSIQGVRVQSATEAWDARTGAPLGYGSTSSMTYDTIGRLVQTPDGGTFTYDAEGRLLTGFGDDASTNVSCGTGNGSTTRRGTETIARSNRPDGGWKPYAYSPDGSVASDPYGRRWHWSNGLPLYGDQGAAAYINVGTDGVLPIGSTLSINDLELNGLAASQHNVTGHAQWAPPNPDHQPCVTQSPVSASANYLFSGNAFGAPIQINGDGTIDDGFNLFGESGLPQVSTALSRALPGGPGLPSYDTRRQPLIRRDPPPGGSGGDGGGGGGDYEGTGFDPNAASAPPNFAVGGKPRTTPSPVGKSASGTAKKFFVCITPVIGLTGLFSNPGGGAAGGLLLVGNTVMKVGGPANGTYKGGGFVGGLVITPSGSSGVDMISNWSTGVTAGSTNISAGFDANQTGTFVFGGLGIETPGASATATYGAPFFTLPFGLGLPTFGC